MGKRAAAVATSAPRDAAGACRAVRGAALRGADAEAPRDGRFDASVAARGPHRSREAPVRLAFQRDEFVCRRRTR